MRNKSVLPLLVLLGLGCKIEASPLVGDWVCPDVGAQTYLTISADGTFSKRSTNPNISPWSGMWKEGSPNNITLSISPSSSHGVATSGFTMDYNVKFVASKLAMLTPAGASFENCAPKPTGGPPNAAPPIFALWGDWTCDSRKADGVAYRSAFRFAKDGAFVYADPQSRLIGTYATSGSTASVQFSQTEVGGIAKPSNIRAAIVIGASAPGSATFDMSLMTSRGAITATVANTCAWAQIAESTRAPAATLCQTNPAACAAIQRNQDIRKSIQDDRCAVLRQQLAGMAAAEYQLAKAGCG